MSKKKNNELENKDTEKEVTLPTNQTGEEITFQSVNPEANELEQENTENEQEPEAKEGENNSVNNPDENQDNSGADDTQSDSQNEPEEKMITLKVEVNFTDKYDNSIKYVAGKEYPFEPKRANELLNDKRGLVSEVK